MSAQGRPAWWQKGMRRKSGGRIEWRFYVQTPAGSKQASAYGRSITELKAERKRIEKLYEFAPERITLNELLDRFVAEKRGDNTIDQRKISDMESRFERLVRPKLGRLSIGALCTNWAIISAHFQALSGKDPNSYVVQRAFDELRRAFKFGISHQWCTLNPMLHLERPKYRATEKRQPFTLEQVFELLRLSTGRDRVIIAFLVMTGVRTWSEMSGLRVRDCNLLKKTVKLSTFVRRTEKGQPVEKPVTSGKPRGKTERAEREIPLVDPLVALLEEHIRSASLGPDDYLFPNQYGGLLRDNNWRTRVWKPLAEAVGRPDAVPYELRHTTNSLLAELGMIAEERAAICGHSEVVNKMVYTKIGLEARRVIMDKLGMLFPNLGPGSRPSGDKGQDEGQDGDGAVA
ncbi:MAG TPA: tyrosine-type recombinase/integrase [Candidatus Baltobacteraceae bacterium]|jgi:integrase|nr:tyrosine-type recombinase/integrase [Candidatus Baltobacteraceae bacterium]